MKNLVRYLSLFVLLTWCSTVVAQIQLNPAPTRVVGQNSLSGNSLNLVEGREFNQPTGIALDLSLSPPALYVADTGNNRVLGFRNSTSFSNGQKADIVIGQTDLQSSFAQDPTSGRTTGFIGPTGLVVDAASNIYVVDSGNNRVMRFPKPFNQSGVIVPDLVIGQNSFGTRQANLNGISASTLSFVPPSGPGFLEAFLAFDSAQNLWIADAGNNRVLRYPAALLAGSPAKSGPAADLVLGQLDFASNSVVTTDQTNLNFFNTPTGIAFDQKGRLFVSESQGSVRSRILVYTTPVVRSGQAANRLIGVVPNTVIPQPLPISEQQFNAGTGGLFIINGGVGIVDTRSNRLLGFNPVDQFTLDVLTQQAQPQYLFGQPNLSSGFSNMGLPDSGPDRISSPSAVAVSGTELFIADTGNHRVIAVPYSSRAIGQASRVLGQDSFSFNAPNLVEGREFRFVSGAGGAEAGIVTDMKSNPPHLYVADPYNNRVLGYRDLRTVKPGDRADIVIGQPDFNHTLVNYPSGDANIQNASGLNSPTGLVLDPAGNLFVADQLNGRVLRFANPFAQPGNLPSANLVIGQRDFTSSKITDASVNTMNQPYGLAFASNNGLLVSDLALNRVLYFPGSSDQLTNGESATIVFGQPDFTSFAATPNSAADNRFFSPRGITTDADDRLYVADSRNNRVVIFDRAPSQQNDPRSTRILPNLGGVRSVYANRSTGEIWIAYSSSIIRYPNFNRLLVGDSPDAPFFDNTPLALTQDVYGNLYTADANNRVQINYPGLKTVNAASFITAAAQPLAPGSIATIFGSTNQFGTATAAATSTPLPTQLAGIQVALNGSPVPLYYVGPNQINFVVPQGAPTNGSADLLVSRLDSSQILGDFPVPLNVASPALFTLDATQPGQGQVAAINQDGTINGKDHPATNGSQVAFFGTGEGVVPNAPPDGVAPPNEPVRTANPQVIIGATADFVPDDNIKYSGLAPGLVGVWQVNVVIPDNVVATSLTNNLTPVVFVVNGIASNGLNAGGTRLQTTMWVTGKK